MDLENKALKLLRKTEELLAEIESDVCIEKMRREFLDAKKKKGKKNAS